jgi:hypothetical protein
MSPAAPAGTPPRRSPRRARTSRRRPGAPPPPPATGPSPEARRNDREAVILLQAALHDALDAFAAIADREPWPTNAALRARCARYALVLRATTPPRTRPT